MTAARRENALSFPSKKTGKLEGGSLLSGSTSLDTGMNSPASPFHFRGAKALAPIRTFSPIKEESVRSIGQMGLASSRLMSAEPVLSNGRGASVPAIANICTEEQ